MPFFWEQKGAIRDSNGKTVEEAIASFRDRPIEPIYNYAVSSVERNMFLTYVQEMINLGKPEDADDLMRKAEKMVEITPYTNWSGD